MPVLRSRALPVMASLAAMAMTQAASAGDFTKDQCKGIAGVVGEVIKTLGAAKHSVEFRQSLRAYLNPPGFTCDGPKDILTPTGADIDAFNTIRSLLLAGSAPISLEKAGLRSIDPMRRAERPTDVVPARAIQGETPQVN